MTRVIVTPHAVERFMQRHAPTLTFDEASETLQLAAENASPLKERSVSGDPLWRADAPPMLLVVKRDHDGYVVVTVLPRSETATARGPSDEELDEMVAAMARLRVDASSLPYATERGGADAVRGEIESLAAEARSALKSLQSEIAQAKQARGNLQSEIHKLAQKLSGPGSGARKKPPAPVAAPPPPNSVPASQLAAVRRDLERQMAHGLRMSAEREAVRRLCARAVRGLFECGDALPAKTALADIFTVEPGMADKRFWKVCPTCNGRWLALESGELGFRHSPGCSDGAKGEVGR